MIQADQTPFERQIERKLMDYAAECLRRGKVLKFDKYFEIDYASLSETEIREFEDALSQAQREIRKLIRKTRR